MKKLILSLTLVALAFAAKAQSTNAITYGWTNTSYFASGVYSNYTLGVIKIPMTSNAVAGLKWGIKQQNASFGLSGTNALDWRDITAYCLWYISETVWAPQAQAEAQAVADAKADAIFVKQTINANVLSDAVLHQLALICKTNAVAP